MTLQNIIFLTIVAALALTGLFHLSFILAHSALVLGGCAAGAGLLYLLTSQGILDWDDWIPRRD